MSAGKFQLVSPFAPTGDQPQAIEALVCGVKEKKKAQVLLGVTGSGKTFTMANVVARLNLPTLVISHNKTLAAQLYQEFKAFFPKNAVCFFVSYYDFYQPEAYLPQTDTYIEKETEINEEIDKLRLAATANILSRKDTLVVASVSCIYNLGSPKNYLLSVLELKSGLRISLETILKRLLDLQYRKSNFDFKRGTFRLRGEYLDVYLSYEEEALRIYYENGMIKHMAKINPLSGEILEDQINSITLYPAKHFLPGGVSLDQVFGQIRQDLEKRIIEFKKENKVLEAERLRKRVNYDLEMIAEVGYVNGIENYSRYFDGRKPGEPPFTLIDYFNEAFGKDWLLFIDESHQTIPQLNGMYRGDWERKKNLVNFGFRLPAAFDNRPLTFAEFLTRIPQVIYVSATPNDWEITQANGQIIEQLIRPTGIPDPEIVIRPTKNQIPDLIQEILERKKRGERVLVTTLTKRIAEDLSRFLQEKKFLSVTYLHSEIETLERTNILDNLRLGKYDCLIGINLLREGLDLPEVSLVAILDADKEGFLRSKTALIQTMGRAARHVDGKVIMYADKITSSMKEAINEIRRRRKIQLAYNLKYGIIPKSIQKPIREKLVMAEKDDFFPLFAKLGKGKNLPWEMLKNEKNDEALTAIDKRRLIKILTAKMKEAANRLDFELAIELRERIKKLREN